MHLRLDYVLDYKLNYSRRNLSLKPRETREDDDRPYVATKLVNIAQCLDLYRKQTVTESSSWRSPFSGLASEFFQTRSSQLDHSARREK